MLYQHLHALALAARRKGIGCHYIVDQPGRRNPPGMVRQLQQLRIGDLHVDLVVHIAHQRMQTLRQSGQLRRVGLVRLTLYFKFDRVANQRCR